MQRVFNLNKWSRLPKGKAIKFEGDRPRAVNLEVNSPDVAHLFLVDNGESKFLARVCGRDTLQFYVDGNYSIGADGADVYFYTVDGEKWTWEDIDPESYAVIRERRPRNLELEFMAAKMAENMSRRMELQAHELEVAMERRARAREARKSEAAGVAGDVSRPPASPGDDPAKAVESGAAGKRGPGRPGGASKADPAEGD